MTDDLKPTDRRPAAVPLFACDDESRMGLRCDQPLENHGERHWFNGVWWPVDRDHPIGGRDG